MSDFVTKLYTIILPLSLMPNIGDPLESLNAGVGGDRREAPSVADLLFRALNMVFSPRAFGSAAPPWRSAAFAKRILIASLHWPPALTLRALEFIGGLMHKDPKLEALLNTEDRTHDGVYRPDIDDPQLCSPFGTSFWELFIMQQSHFDHQVREESIRLAKSTLL